MRIRIVAAALALTVAAAFGVAALVSSTAGGIRAAFAGVFSTPTLRVVISAHSTNAAEEAVAGRYSVVLTVTGKNGHGPLSGPGGPGNYEISVLRGGADLGDVVVVHNAVYGRINLRAIDGRSYASAVHSLAGLPPGAERDVVSAVVHGRWVGISDTTIESLVKSLDRSAVPRPTGVKFDNLRHAFSLSFVQSWDAWTSIHQLSSRNGVTRYSVKLPVQHFVSTFLHDVKGSLLKDLPASDVRIARAELRAASSAVDRIPAGLAVPMIFSVTNGSLTNVVISHKGDSLSLAISHPAAGVTAPPAPTIVTESMLRSLLSGFGGGAFAHASKSGTSGIPMIEVPPLVSGNAGASSGYTATSSASSTG